MNESTRAGLSSAAAGRAPANSTKSAVISLESLAPRYVKSQHETYLRRLNEAIEDSRNRNLALTGRYGTGKSSILDQFQETHKKATLRLAISTLGPESDADSTTNRIQKELVKQLIYSASPKTLRRSTFSRWAPLSPGRAVLEAVGIVGLLGVLLALLGWLPDLVGAGNGQPALQRVALWLVFGAVAITIATGLRLLMDGRIISDVSAAGATVSLSERTLTYFDKYLDEIVNYFDAQSPDFVVFEDLDRFGDPHIFEALRELNTLLNSTSKRVEKGQPVRFIYAVRDSLFEKLGSDTEAEGDDAATAETVRANRTKFFDIVIPVVPFISHRNARDLLRDLLADANITDIERPLVDLIARHATDMRLLVNMRNEYLVFAERLLEANRQAPGLTPSGLFALVAYKNFHLEDFENISRGGSDLDELYRYRRDLVRSCVSRLESAKRDLLKGRGRAHSMASLAAELGVRLSAVGEAVKTASPSYASSSYYLRYVLGSQGFKPEQISAPSFWAAVGDAGIIDVQATGDPDNNGAQLLGLQRAQIDGLFPEAFDAKRWNCIDEDQVRAEVAQLDEDVAFLRGASFGALAGAGTFMLTVDGPSGDGAGVERVSLSFGQLVDATMESELARELVRRGYLDRNFALYAAQFYGAFTGVDVATFVVQSVQTNTMEIDYGFTSPSAVENLLSEAGEDFTRTVSAYNVAVVNYLLENRGGLAENVVVRMISSFDDQAREFLAAYFSTGKQRPLLAARLSARGWRDIFTYMATSDDVPDDVRVTLVDAALQGADATQNYDLDGDVAKYIGEHYREMPTFTATQDDGHLETVVNLFKRANVRVSDLAKVHETLRAQLVAQSLYELTAPNLRAALDTTGTVSLDEVRKSDVVYAYCLADPARYLAAVEGDETTQHTVEAPDTLQAALVDVADSWSDDLVGELISYAAPGSALERVTVVPASTWPALAGASLFRPSLVNLQAYRAEVGTIDEHLAQLLLRAGTIEVDEDDDAVTVDKVAGAVAIVNSSGTIPAARQRVGLVCTLGLVGPVRVAQLQPEGGELLALLINAGIVGDDAATFRHFQPAGWSALGPAIVASKHFADFVAPDLLDGMVPQVFSSAAVRDKIGQTVVFRLGEFVADTDGEALIAASWWAVQHGAGLPAEQVQRVAATGPGARDVTLRLLQTRPPTPAEVIGALTQLGWPYSNMSTRQELEFEVPYDDTHRAVFGQLDDAGLCKTSKKRMQDRLIVKLV